jgi:hypothetical protein
MDIKERTSAILDKIMEVASAADSAAANEERIVTLEENYTMLMECILEMSEIIYA